MYCERSGWRFKRIKWYLKFLRCSNIYRYIYYISYSSTTWKSLSVKLWNMLGWLLNWNQLECFIWPWIYYISNYNRLLFGDNLSWNIVFQISVENFNFDSIFWKVVCLYEKKRKDKRYSVSSKRETLFGFFISA